MTARRAARTSHIALAILVSELLDLDDPKSVAHIAESSGLHHLTVAAILRAFRAARVARIAEWGRDCRGRGNVPLWALGAGRNAPRPPRLDRNEIRRTRRALARQARSTAELAQVLA